MNEYYEDEDQALIMAGICPICGDHLVPHDRLLNEDTEDEDGLYENWIMCLSCDFMEWLGTYS